MLGVAKRLRIVGPREAVVIGQRDPLVFIGGPCAIESRAHAVSVATRIGGICDMLGMPWIFKASYNKDARSSPATFGGVGLEAGLDALAAVRSQCGVPIVSDFADPKWAAATGEVCDMVQVPAYLCRQTSVLTAAGRTGKPVLLKKGQFMSPGNMANSVRKLEAAGCTEILLTERGTFFGYQMLVNDFRSLPIMARTGYPVCFDGTHSLQLPTDGQAESGGQPEFVLPLVRAAVACGVSSVFLEVHDDPPHAMSDRASVIHVDVLPVVLAQARAIHDLRLASPGHWCDDERVFHSHQTGNP